MRSFGRSLWVRLIVYILLIAAGTFAAVEGMLAVQDWMNMRYTQQVLEEAHCCGEEEPSHSNLGDLRGGRR
ncbi:MAG: hypothetical protein ACK40X_02100 [Armatimonadota bacterium]